MNVCVIAQHRITKRAPCVSAGGSDEREIFLFKTCVVFIISLDDELRAEVIAENGAVQA